jgi:hypothetical protein
MEATLKGYVVQTIPPTIDPDTGEPKASGSAIVLADIAERPVLTRVWGFMDAPGAVELMEAGLFDEVYIECEVKESTWRDSGQARVDVKWTTVKVMALPEPEVKTKS